MDRDEALRYARELAQLGERVNVIAATVPSDAPSPRDINEARAGLEKVHNAFEQYNKCLSPLQSLVPPREVESDHQDLHPYVQY